MAVPATAFRMRARLLANPKRGPIFLTPNSPAMANTRKKKTMSR